MGYDSNVLALNPKHYWKLDETSGTVATDYGSTPVNGVYTNGPTLNQSAMSCPSGVEPATLSSGPSVAFDGTDDFVSIATNPNYTALTLAMWVKNNGTADRYWFEFCWSSGSSLPIAIGGAGDFGNVNNWSIGCFNGSGWTGLAGTSLSPSGQERFIVATIASAGRMRLWENARLKGDVAAPTFSAYSAGLGLRIARRWDGGAGNYSNGRVSGVAMWDSVLTDAQIRSLVPPPSYVEQTSFLEDLAPNSTPWRPYGEAAAGGGGGGGGTPPTTGQLWPRGNW